MSLVNTPDRILPTLNSTGYFELKFPLNALMQENERYTCKAIRNLSDYIANNEDPKSNIYGKYKLPEEDWENDVLNDAFIISLQSDVGHWLYVPEGYIVKYPITNGTPYRAVMIGVSLPSVPATTNFEYINTDIRNLIKDTLGVTPVIKVVETSRVMLVEESRHLYTQTERNLLSDNRRTDRGRYASLVLEHDKALAKIRELELFIKNNLDKLF